MKILYVKNNSERTKKYQLKTIIYEENSQRYVKKEALSKNSLDHLKKMKESYNKLNESIIDEDIKLAKIIDESENSLTFEYIDGISFEKKLNQVKDDEKQFVKLIKQEYLSKLENSFKTTVFDSNTMVTDELKELFGDFDYSIFDGKKCLDGITNIDFIFSNMIYSNGKTYLIDYEWVSDLYVPIDLILFRSIENWDGSTEKLKSLSFNTNYIFALSKMTKHFIDRVVEDGFFLYQHNYNKNFISLEDMPDKDNHIKNLEQEIKNLNNLKVMKLYNKLKNMLPKSLKNTLKLIKNDPQKIKKVYQVFRTQGLRAVISKIKTNLNLSKYKFVEPSLSKKIESELNSFAKQPKISVIMPVYNVDPQWLDLAVKSIQNQWYKNWEVCIIDDKSTNEETINYLKALNNPKIKVKFLEKNLNISGASNQALEMTSGEYILLMDNDDEITVNALYEVVKAINEKDAEFIYSDEDKVDLKGTYSMPHFKPDFAPDMILSQNYMSHLGVIKKSLIDKVGGFTMGLEGAQDFDLYLKVLEHTDKVHHISKVLYHWRMIPGSTAAGFSEKSYAQEAGRKAIEQHLARKNILGTALNGKYPGTYRVKYPIKDKPLISIVIPFKDKPELLKMCVESILNKSTYQNYEIIGISNNSEEKETFDEMKRLSNLDVRVNFYEYNVPFNFSQINNYGVNTHSKGEYILLLNNDIEIITEDWLEEMLMHAQRDSVGCVGSKLYYPNDTVQHAGVVIGIGGVAGHSQKHFRRDDFGYFTRLHLIQNVSAVTAACLMVKRTIYDEVGGLEESLIVAFNDVDFCLKIQEKGYRNIFTPFCEAYHHESISRGYEDTIEKQKRFKNEIDYMLKRHAKVLKEGDPFYNCNLTLDKEDFSLR